MVGVGVVVGLLEFPAGDVGVDAVVECRVHLLGHRVKQVRGADDGGDFAVDVADENNRALSSDDVAATAEGTVLHVALHDVHAALVGEVDAGRFIEGDHVPHADESTLTAGEVHEHLCRRRLAARDEVTVGAHLLINETLAGATWPQFDRIEIPLHERHQAQHVVQFPTPGVVRMVGLVAHRTHEEVEPLIAGETLPGGAESLHVAIGNLDRADGLDEEGAVLVFENIGLVVANGDLRPHAAHEQSLMLFDQALVDVDEVEV